MACSNCDEPPILERADKLLWHSVLSCALLLWFGRHDNQVDFRGLGSHQLRSHRDRDHAKLDGRAATMQQHAMVLRSTAQLYLSQL